jgi:hypothetical protein
MSNHNRPRNQWVAGSDLPSDLIFTVDDQIRRDFALIENKEELRKKWRKIQ